MSEHDTTSHWQDADVAFMRAALELAGAASGEEVPVGAIVVSEQRVVGRGRNRTIVERDPTAHAEIVALRAAAAETGNHRLTGATLYVTLEPCVMCVGAIVHARISRLVFGAYDANAGAAGSVIDLCHSRLFGHRIEVNGGLLAEDCGKLLTAFFQNLRASPSDP
ncbi:MAG TPA: tRNA adenosine(34) deaminase TadA, partial [Woeseiaceae bacterium]|nr:tRNA adenosine(34) deaminase TadA [Woeseiaceae bacterium]